MAQFSTKSGMTAQDCLVNTIDTVVLEMLGWERGIGLSFT